MSNQEKKQAETNAVALLDEHTTVITPGGIELENREGLWVAAETMFRVPEELLVSIGWGKGSYLASLFDLVSTKMAMQFGEPKIVAEDEWRVKVAVPVEYWNLDGRKKTDSEVYEIDCNLMYEKSRFSYEKVEWEGPKGSKHKVVKEKAEIKVIRDPKRPGLPPQVIAVLSDKAEGELYENFLTLKRNKLAKAITCAHRRLTQRALGIKGFEYDPKDENWQEKVWMKIRTFLPAETNRKAGIKAINDLGEEPLGLENKEEASKKTAGAGKPEPVVAAGKTETDGKPEDIGEGPDLTDKKETKETVKAPAGTPAGLICSGEGCGVKVTKKVSEYSQKVHGSVLCYDCQNKKNKGA